MGIIPAIVILLIIASLLLYLFYRNLRRRRLVRGGLQLLTSLTVTSLALLLLAIVLNLYTYERLTHEQPVASLQIAQVDEKKFNVTLMTTEGSTKTYLLNGDEWVLEAKVLKWKGWANLLGLNSQFRLDRLSGRYTNIAEHISHYPVSWQLSNTRGIDVWAMVRKHPGLLPFVDASYGSGTYLSMVDGTEYVVVMSQTGLLARLIQRVD